jgi:hypothetical protein
VNERPDCSSEILFIISFTVGVLCVSFLGLIMLLFKTKFVKTGFTPNLAVNVQALEVLRRR